MKSNQGGEAPPFHEYSLSLQRKRRGKGEEKERKNTGGETTRRRRTRRHQINGEARQISLAYTEPLHRSGTPLSHPQQSSAPDVRSQKKYRRDPSACANQPANKSSTVKGGERMVGQYKRVIIKPFVHRRHRRDCPRRVPKEWDARETPSSWLCEAGIILHVYHACHSFLPEG